MARHITWVLTLLLTCAPAVGLASQDHHAREDKSQSSKDKKDKPVAAANPRDDRDRWKWWLYDRAELGITDQQSKDLNDIFESTLPKLRETRHEMERAQEELSRTMKERRADLATVSLLVDRVESARSQNSKLRVLMLYRMDQLLTPDQRVKVEALRARQEAARRERQSGPGHRFKP